MHWVVVQRPVRPSELVAGKHCRNGDPLFCQCLLGLLLVVVAVRVDRVIGEIDGVHDPQPGLQSATDLDGGPERCEALGPTIEPDNEARPWGFAARLMVEDQHRGGLRHSLSRSANDIPLVASSAGIKTRVYLLGENHSREGGLVVIEIAVTNEQQRTLRLLGQLSRDAPEATVDGALTTVASHHQEVESPFFGV